MWYKDGGRGFGDGVTLYLRLWVGLCRFLGREETEEEGRVVVFVVVNFDAAAEEGDVAVVVEAVVSVTCGASVAFASSRTPPSSSSRNGSDFTSAGFGAAVEVISFADDAATVDVDEVDGFRTSPLTAFSLITIPTFGFLNNTFEGAFFFFAGEIVEVFMCSCETFLCFLSDFIFLVSP